MSAITVAKQVIITILIVFGVWLLLIFTGTTCWADDIYHYVIYRENNFPQDRYRTNKITATKPIYKNFSDLGNKTIRSVKDGQPCKVTKYDVSRSGKYSTLTFSPKSTTELSALQSMEKQHYAKLLSVTSITTTYDKRLGGYVTEATSKNLSTLPDDFVEVAVSTTNTSRQ